MIYTESQGNAELRAGIANTYSNVSAEDIVVLGTPVEGIYLAARTLLDPGDEVIVLSPAYDALTRMFEHVAGSSMAVSYTHLTLPTSKPKCRSRWSPYH